MSGSALYMLTEQIENISSPLADLETVAVVSVNFRWHKRGTRHFSGAASATNSAQLRGPMWCS